VRFACAALGCVVAIGGASDPWRATHVSKRREDDVPGGGRFRPPDSPPRPPRRSQAHNRIPTRTPTPIPSLCARRQPFSFCACAQRNCFPCSSPPPVPASVHGANHLGVCAVQLFSPWPIVQLHADLRFGDCSAQKPFPASVHGANQLGDISGSWCALHMCAV